MQFSYKHNMITALLILLQRRRTSTHTVLHLYRLNPLLKTILQIVVVGNVASALLLSKEELPT